eukprot:COSAG01_NODE_49761_length_369_cov_0.903704_1_plen_20_part_01
MRGGALRGECVMTVSDGRRG